MSKGSMVVAINVIAYEILQMYKDPELYKIQTGEHRRTIATSRFPRDTFFIDSTVQLRRLETEIDYIPQYPEMDVYIIVDKSEYPVKWPYPPTDVDMIIYIDILYNKYLSDKIILDKMEDNAAIEIIKDVLASQIFDHIKVVSRRWDNYAIRTNEYCNF